MIHKYWCPTDVCLCGAAGTCAFCLSGPITGTWTIGEDVHPVCAGCRADLDAAAARYDRTHA